MTVKEKLLLKFLIGERVFVLRRAVLLSNTKII